MFSMRGAVRGLGFSSVILRDTTQRDNPRKAKGFVATKRSVASPA